MVWNGALKAQEIEIRDLRFLGFSQFNVVCFLSVFVFVYLFECFGIVFNVLFFFA
jgi:hypothetical protein